MREFKGRMDAQGISRQMTHLIYVFNPVKITVEMERKSEDFYTYNVKFTIPDEGGDP